MGRFSGDLGKRVLNKGPQIGFCVICGTHGKLSRDHVPPRKCNNISDVELKYLGASDNAARIGVTSQGGTHYKTLCGECNSKRLGIDFDPSLIKLSNEITSMVVGANNRIISLPDTIHPLVKPQRIARSVVGHLLAAVAVEETKTGLVSTPIEDSLREYFLDKSKPIPKNLEIYYWLYPSRNQIIIKHMMKSSMRYRENIFGHVIKFLPLGFWLVWNKREGIDLNLNNLVPEKMMGIDDVKQIQLNLYSIPRLSFPEKPEGDESIFLNTDYAVISSPKGK